MSSELIHISVLNEEVLSYFSGFGEGQNSNRRLILDCTVGGGGHSQAMLEKDPLAFLLGFDRDLTALERARSRLNPYSDRLMLVHGNFRNVKAILKNCEAEIFKKLKMKEVASNSMQKLQFAFILADLGLSSFQIDEPCRGFSFLNDGPLDMRMDPSQVVTADQVINSYPLKSLQHVLERGGVGALSSRLAKALVDARPLTSTSEFADVCKAATPIYEKSFRKNPATVPFQAIRIEVNDELSGINEFLDQVPDLMEVGGRFAAISFHSLEDRLVTSRMRKWTQPNAAIRKLPTQGVDQVYGRLLTKHAVVPGSEEVSKNPRSRSGKLRVFERTSKTERQSFTSAVEE